MADRIYSFIGLATKARKLLSGDETCERAIRAGKVILVLVAGDASENTKKKFQDMCKYRNISIRVFGMKDELGRYAGKDTRSVAAILDSGFAKRLMELIDGED
jgi:ribosomal protein L7Ae-like RNA K-turn-binding protein